MITPNKCHKSARKVANHFRRFINGISGEGDSLFSKDDYNEMLKSINADGLTAVISQYGFNRSESFEFIIMALWKK